MRANFRRPNGFQDLARNAEQTIKKRLENGLVRALKQFHGALQDTPVYTGKTIINFRWSVGAPITGYRSPISQPRLPGTTSDLPLGEEPRRTANQGVIDEEFKILIATIRERGPYIRIFLRNNSPSYELVEYGAYADSDEEARTPPGGIIRRGEYLFKTEMQKTMRGFGRG